MKKAIVILSGAPSGKNRFTQICKQSAWVWGINPKNHTSDSDTLNKSEHEEKYLSENIERFFADESDVKKDLSGKEYDTFLLIAHGVSGKKTEALKNEFGVFKFHVVGTSEEITPAMIEHNDKIIVEASGDFDKEVLDIIDVITHKS